MGNFTEVVQPLAVKIAVHNLSLTQQLGLGYLAIDRQDEEVT